MNDKIVSIEEFKGNPHKKMIEAVEGLLEQAKSGELLGLVFVGFYPDGKAQQGNFGADLSCAYIMGALQMAALNFYHETYGD